MHEHTHVSRVAKVRLNRDCVVEFLVIVRDGYTISSHAGSRMMACTHSRSSKSPRYSLGSSLASFAFLNSLRGSTRASTARMLLLWAMVCFSSQTTQGVVSLVMSDAASSYCRGARSQRLPAASLTRRLGLGYRNDLVPFDCGDLSFGRLKLVRFGLA